MKLQTLALMLIVVISNVAFAVAPTLLPFQGRLTDQTGTPVADGTKLVRFEIYSTQTGGASPLWTEQHTVSINGGLVNILMGTQNSLESIDFDQQLYLQIQVDVAEPIGTITPADPPMLPRQVILPAVLAKKSVLSIDSQDSELLDGLDSTKFIRNDQSSTLNGSLSITNGNLSVSGDLTVNGGEIASTNNTGTLKIMGGAGQGGQLDLGGGTTDGSIKLRTGIGTGEQPVRLTLLNNGNVGIGTTNPLSLLHLSATSGGNQLELTDASAGANLKNWIIGSETGALRFVKVDDAHTGSNEFMRITSDGKVGIGTTTPSTAFQVAGTAYFNNELYIAGGLLYLQGGGDILSASSSAQLRIIGGGGNKGGQIDLFGGSAGGLVRFRTGTGSGEQPIRLLITSDGYVGIGTTDPQHRLHVVGSGYATGSFIDGSSRELKENIEDLTSDKASEALDALEPVTFNYRADPTEGRLGFIAEDVPDLLATNDRKGLNAMDFIAVLTKIVQELKIQNQNQQAQIDALKAEIEALKAK